jgi:hypothetical protein
MADTKVSYRGVAIKHFNVNVPALRDKTMSLEVFRATTIAQIAEELSLEAKDCGYLFNKARRAAERSGKCADLDFGAVKRAEPIVKPAKTAAAAAVDGATGSAGDATGGATAPAPAQATGPHVLLELGTDGVILKSKVYAERRTAAMLAGGGNKRGGNWIFFAGDTAPEVGTVYVAPQPAEPQAEPQADAQPQAEQQAEPQADAQPAAEQQEQQAETAE